MSAICVYCASGPVDEQYLKLAAQVGAAIGEGGHELVSGGGNVSMMGAIAEATRAAGGRTIGIIPAKLITREVADTSSDELVVTDTMRERKALMDERADAFITLPGGLGTLEELFETWTGGYLGMHDKPMVLLDPFDHYGPLLTWLGDLQRQGFVAGRALELLHRTSDVDEALAYCVGQG